MSAAAVAEPVAAGRRSGRAVLLALLALWLVLEWSDLRRRPVATTAGATAPEVTSRAPEDAAARYLLELALGPATDATARVHRWQRDVDVAVLGAPTAEDREWVASDLAELAVLTGLAMRVAEGRPEIEIHFAPPRDFPRLEPNYARGSMGFYWLWWSHGDALSRARILIPQAGHLEPARRRRLVAENLGRALGLYHPSKARPESLFYGGPNWNVTQLAEIDREVIRRLYAPTVVSGMDRAALLNALAPAAPAGSGA